MTDRRENWELFYTAENLDKDKILRDNETEEGANDGYICVCCFCTLNNTPNCEHDCCKTGVPCGSFIKDNLETTKWLKT